MGKGASAYAEEEEVGGMKRWRGISFIAVRIRVLVIPRDRICCSTILERSSARGKEFIKTCF
jgi:hypothetical protein